MVTTLVATVVIAAFFSAWRLSRANEMIRLYLLEKIRPFVDENTDIRAFNLDLGSASLNGVTLVPRDSSFTLEIESVRIGYRFWNLILHGFQPEKAAHEVLFVKPSLVLRRISGGRDSVETPGMRPSSLTGLSETMRRITVSDGSLFIENASGKRARVASFMSGWIRLQSEDSADVRLAGRLFESDQKNLSIEGVMDLAAMRHSRMHVLLESSKPSPEMPLLVPEFIRINSGRMWGEAHYDRRTGSRGFFKLEEGSFSIPKAGLDITDMRFSAEIRDDTLDIHGSLAGFEGTPLLLDGIMTRFLDPQFQLRAHCERLDLPALIRKASPAAEIPVSGHAALDIRMQGGIQNPLIEGDVDIHDFRIFSSPFGDLRTDIVLKDSLLSATGKADSASNRIDLKMDLDFARFDRGFGLDLGLDGDFSGSFPKWVQNRLETARTRMQVHWDGWLTRFHARADAVVDLASRNGADLHIRPTVVCHEGLCRVGIASNGALSGSGDVSRPATSGMRWIVNLRGLEAFAGLFFGDMAAGGADALSVSGRFSGDPAKWDLNLSGRGMEDTTRAAGFHANLVSQKRSRAERSYGLNAEWRASGGQSLPVEASWTTGPGMVDQVAMRIGDFMELHGSLPLSDAAPLSANLLLRDFRMELLHPFIPNSRKFRGGLTGDAVLSGTRLHPDIQISARLKEGVFHGIGTYEGDVRARWDGYGLQFLGFDLFQDDVALWTGEVEKTAGDSLRGRFFGEDIDLQKIMRSVTGDTALLKGRGAFDFFVSGRDHSPVIRGNLSLKDGFAGGFSFREIKARITDSLLVNSSFQAGALLVENGEWRRKDDMDVFFMCRIPHDPGASARIDVEGRGNILGLLPEWTSFFRKAEGAGSFRLTWSGRPELLALESGICDITSGFIELEDVVRRIDNISGQAVLVPESRFLHIVSLEGEAGGKFSITTIPEMPDHRPPLFFESMGFSLGYVRLVTVDKGIHIHIPGLMEKGETGWLSASEKEGGKGLFLSGPVLNPNLSGKVRVRDTRLTYPFLPGDGKEDGSSSTSFLDKVNWDLDIIPESDVHYVRGIQSPFGNIDVDLQLREGYGMFSLDGIIETDDLVPSGRLASSAGSLELLDHLFRPEQIFFEYPIGASQPILSGRAYTTVIDSMGVPSTVWLTIMSTNTETGVEAASGGWENIQFRFSTDNPNLGRTEADLLAALGYSGTSIKDRAYDAIGIQVENLVFRPLIRPLERTLRTHLGLDIVKFSSMFSRNLFQWQSGERAQWDPRMLLRSTRWTVGKYLAPGFFITYAGQVQNDPYYYYHVNGLSFRHALNLELTLQPDLFLEMEYTYDSHLMPDRRVNKRIWLRHVFSF